MLNPSAQLSFLKTKWDPAETLSFADGMDTAQFVRQLAEEFQLISNESTTTMITDSRSLFDAANTTSQIKDRRLRVEMSAIRESKERGEIQIVWTSGDKQLADVLTKKGASPLALRDAVSSGSIQAWDDFSATQFQFHSCLIYAAINVLSRVSVMKIQFEKKHFNKEKTDENVKYI